MDFSKLEDLRGKSVDCIEEINEVVKQCGPETILGGHWTAITTALAEATRSLTQLNTPINVAEKTITRANNGAQ